MDYIREHEIYTLAIQAGHRYIFRYMDTPEGRCALGDKIASWCMDPNMPLTFVNAAELMREIHAEGT